MRILSKYIYCASYHFSKDFTVFFHLESYYYIKYNIMYNKSNLTFCYQFNGNLGIFYCRGTYIFIVRITFKKKADATIYTQYYLLYIPVIKISCYHWLYPTIHCTEYDEITMINETRQNIVVLTTNIFAVYAWSRGTPYLIEMQSKPVPLLLGPFKYSDKVIANVGGAIDAKYRQIVLQSVVVHKPLNSSANNWSNGN